MFGQGFQIVKALPKRLETQIGHLKKSGGSIIFPMLKTAFPFGGLRRTAKKNSWLVVYLPTPLKNMKVNWADELPNIWKIKTCSSHHQPVTIDMIYHTNIWVFIFNLINNLHTNIPYTMGLFHNQPIPI